MFTEVVGELTRAIERFIHYYNNDRIKEKLGGLSPKAYRERMKIRVERIVCKTKSSKQNAYSIKSNFMGSLYIAGGFSHAAQRACITCHA